MVPSWAATDGQGAVEAPADQEQRFRSFRTSLGKFVANGSAAHLRSAVKEYARTATGGGSVAIDEDAVAHLVRRLQREAQRARQVGQRIVALHGLRRQRVKRLQQLRFGQAAGDGDDEEPIDREPLAERLATQGCQTSPGGAPGSARAAGRSPFAGLRGLIRDKN